MAKDATVFLSVVLPVCLIYILTAFPSTPGGDSGELLAESCLLGTAHPPGYPLFTLLAHLVGKYVPMTRFYLENMKLKFDERTEIAWKVNVMCCFFGALAAGFVGITAVRLASLWNYQKSPFAVASISAFLYGFSPLVWEYSVSAEVFALNNFLCAALLYFTVLLYQEVHRVEGSRTGKVYLYLFLGALLSGCCLSNQHASIIELAVILPFVVYVARSKIFTVVGVIGVTVSFLVGISPYAYLYYASLTPKQGSWGDLTTMKSLVGHFLRSEYGTFQLGVKQGTESMLQRIVLYLQFASAETYHLVFPLVGLGVFWLRDRHYFAKDSLELAEMERLQKEEEERKKNQQSEKKKEKEKKTIEKNVIPVVVVTWGQLYPIDPLPITGCLAAVWLFYLLFWHGVLSNLPLSAPMPFAVHSRFWMQPNIPLCVFAGLGIAMLTDLCDMAISRTDGETSTTKSKSKQATFHFTVEMTIVAILLAILMSHRYVKMDRSKEGWVMHNYGQFLLDTLPRDAILLTHTDLDWNTARYMHSCRRHRVDGRLLSLQMMPFPWFRKQQVPLYPNLKFPDTNFPGISTERTSPGNTRMVHEFLLANGANDLLTTYYDLNDVLVREVPAEDQYFSAGGIFLDMQSVNEAEIETGGQWHNLTLVPWGLVYRVQKPLPLADLVQYHQPSLIMMEKVQAKFPSASPSFLEKFSEGSWEFAVASVVNDVRYQTALFLLTHALETLKAADMDNLSIILDRLLISSRLLLEAQEVNRKYKAFSSSPLDLDKNTALSWMRLQGVLNVCVMFTRDLEKHFYGNRHTQNAMITKRLIDSYVNRPKWREMTRKAIGVLKDFVDRYPNDSDTATFKQAIEKFEHDLKEEHN